MGGAEKRSEGGCGVVIGDSTYDLNTKVSETNSIWHTWSDKFRAMWRINQQFRWTERGSHCPRNRRWRRR